MLHRQVDQVIMQDQLVQLCASNKVNQVKNGASNQGQTSTGASLPWGWLRCWGG